MDSYSPGIKVAWQLAAQEASHLRCWKIETDHLLIAITKIAEIGDSIDQIANEQKLPNLIEISSEAKQVAEAFKKIRVPTSQLRNQLRGALTCNMAPDYIKPEIIHRSEKCKATFNNAKSIPKKELEVQLIHLLISILKNCSKLSRNVFVYHGIDIKVSTSIIESVYVINNALKHTNKPSLN